MSCTRVIDFWHEGKNLQWYSMTSRRKRICLRRLLLFFKNVQAKSAPDGALFLYRIVPSFAELRYRGVDIRGAGRGDDLVARLEGIERRTYTADIRRSAQAEDLFYHCVHVPLP